MKQYTNQEWYEGLLHNDDDAISDFYDKTNAQLASLCRKYNVNEVDSEQIFIDAFAICLHNIQIGKYKFEGHNPSSYAYKIAYLKMQEHFRTAPPVTIMEALDEPINEDWAKQFFKEEESRDLFQQAFSHLGEPCKTILTLYYVEDLKDQQIADDARVPDYNNRGSVNRKKHECSDKFRELLTKNGFLS
jgi:RNA polymerase sigma factor (sigma-70 family)